MRREKIRSLTRRYAKRPHRKLFIRFTHDDQTILRDMDNIDVVRSRKDIEREYGALRSASMHPALVELHYFGQFISRLGIDVFPGPKDEAGNSEFIFDLYEPEAQRPRITPASIAEFVPANSHKRGSLT